MDFVVVGLESTGHYSTNLILKLYIFDKYIHNGQKSIFPIAKMTKIRLYRILVKKKEIIYGLYQKRHRKFSIGTK